MYCNYAFSAQGRQSGLCASISFRVTESWRLRSPTPPPPVPTAHSLQCHISLLWDTPKDGDPPSLCSCAVQHRSLEKRLFLISNLNVA